MKNLIKGIKSLRLGLSYAHSEYSNGFINGKNKAIEEILEIINQYNIITAPKSIKLSEIVNRLNERLKENLMDSYMKVLIKRDKTKNFITVFYKDTSYKIPSENNIFSFWNNDSIGMPEHTNFKWLYALWIAGTEIVDDLEENEC